MHEYDLERLNTRSFEQLVQALALEILGPHISIFGDGPDGGREASFSGSVPFPTKLKGWKGDGIIQAKFRQEPSSTPKENADWLIKNLKQEFSRFTPNSKRGNAKALSHKCPDYYIIATNVKLSGVRNVGGKDSVEALLKSYKRTHGLKDFKIWDGTQIRRYLDHHTNIRTTYSAWLTPGDVLAKLLDLPLFRGTDFISTMYRYLEAELLDDQFARLSQGGYTDAKAIPLSTVFIDAPIEISNNKLMRLFRTPTSQEEFITQDEKQHLSFLEALFEAGSRVLKPSYTKLSTEPDSRNRPHPSRIVLIGGPGQGKTTVGQFACQLYRAELLKFRGGPSSPEVTQALQCFSESADQVPRVRTRRYPLRVDLKNLAASLAGTGEYPSNNLFDYLVNRIKTRTNTVITSDQFREWLTVYPWLLVLDGLDEVPASSNRKQVLQAIRDFVTVDAHHADADLLILATTRPQGYSAEFDPILYLHLTLMELTPANALNYGLKLAKARHPNQLSRVSELTSSLKRATDNPSTARLMQSPLQVTIMLALIEGGGEPPEQRWKLFHDYYDVIYRREKERGTPFSSILSKFEPELHLIHHRVGWLLQSRNAETGKTNKRLSHTEFEDLVEQQLIDSGHEDKSQRKELVSTIRTAATDRLVFLVGNTENEIGFEIRSLQEFMASEHIFDGGDACIQMSIKAIAPHSYWQNIFLFAAGRILFERRALADTLFAVCAELNESTDDKMQAASFAGARLALALLIDGVARNQPKHSKMFARLGARGLDSFDKNIFNTIFEIISNDTDDVWKEEILNRLSTVEGKFPEHIWLLCSILSRKKSWAWEACLKWFPWRKPQAEIFIKQYSSRHHEIPTKFWDEISKYIHYYPANSLESRIHQGGNKSATIFEQYVAWFNEISHHSNKIEIPIILNEGRKSLAYNILIAGHDTRRIWASFLTLPAVPRDAHPNWKVFNAIALFSAKPTIANLITQLHLISKTKFDKNNQYITYHAPWQIQTCLLAKKDGLPWAKIIKVVADGGLGVEDDWNRWEKEFSTGITFEKFLFPSSFCITNTHWGYLLRTGGWSYSANDTEVHAFTSTLISRVLKWPELTKHNRLLNLCSNGLHREGKGGDKDLNDLLLKFAETCHKLGAEIDSTLFIAILNSEIAVDQKLDILNKIAPLMEERPWYLDWHVEVQSFNERLHSLIQSIPLNKKYLPLIKAISKLPPQQAMNHISEYFLIQSKTDNKALSVAKGFLLLYGLRWRILTPADAAATAYRYLDDYQVSVLQMLHFIDTQGLVGEDIENFTLSLLELIQSNYKMDYIRTKNSLSSLLTKLIERRPALSHLPDPYNRTRQ